MNQFIDKIMEELEIKHEFDEDIEQMCRTCLSIGRKLLPLGQYSNVYLKLTSDYAFQSVCTEQLQICWECYTLLHKVAQFQCKVQKANDVLLLGQSHVFGTLSSLTTIILNDTHPHTIYINGLTNVQTETKTKNDFVDQYENLTESFVENDDTSPETTQIIMDLKTEVKVEVEIQNMKKAKSNNRWAQKRALQNKKPKFKMITNKELDKTIFRKVQINSEELKRGVEEERGSEYYKSKLFKCEKCVFGFENENLLEKHMWKHHRKHQNLYTCDICSKSFDKKRHLSLHISNHYKKYECTLCQFTCYSKRRRCEHIDKHTKVFQCLKCDLRFGCRREFFKHFKDWHEKFTCDYCGVSFKMRYCIKDHIRKQHSPFECVPCGKRFARYSGLWLHKKTRHGGAAPAAYCVECDKVYADVYRYRWHLANSTRHKPRKTVRVPCPGCDKVFSKNIYMKDHYNLVHLKFYKYRCEACDKNFIRNADLVKHKRRVHEGILPPKNKICYMCGRGFTTNKILTNHVRTHTGERPFACVHCPARFAQATALQGHVRALHDPAQY